jgi:hypothetical protein
MRNALKWGTASLVLLASTGCYHAVVDTGRPATGPVIEKQWANSFLYGLVPPAVVQTASACPNGVAVVETQHSFLNQVAAGLTFGIYTPITITVRCAGAGSAMAPSGNAVVTVAAGASEAEEAAALEAAATRSVREHTPVIVTFAGAAK